MHKLGKETIEGDEEEALSVEDIESIENHDHNFE
jgi:hypothetical protein